MKNPDPNLQAFVDFGNAAAKAGEILVKSITPALKVVSEFIDKFYQQLYQTYIDNGAVYGDSPEGFERWCKDLAEQRRIEDEIERHNDLRDWEEVGKRIAAQMRNEIKPKGKAVKLPETEKDDDVLPSSETIKKAQELARSISPTALALFEAKPNSSEN